MNFCFIVGRYNYIYVSAVPGYVYHLIQYTYQLCLDMFMILYSIRISCSWICLSSYTVYVSAVLGYVCHLIQYTYQLFLDMFVILYSIRISCAWICVSSYTVYVSAVRGYVCHLIQYTYQLCLDMFMISYIIYMYQLCLDTFIILCSIRYICSVWICLSSYIVYESALSVYLNLIRYMNKLCLNMFIILYTGYESAVSGRNTFTSTSAIQTSCEYHILGLYEMLLQVS